MVGASLKSRSLVENCWFSNGTIPRSRGDSRLPRYSNPDENNDSPLARGQLQNAKSQRTLSEHGPFLNGRIHCRSRSRKQEANRKEAPEEGARIFHGVEKSFPWRGKRVAIFSMAWKMGAGIFHGVENPGNR